MASDGGCAGMGKGGEQSHFPLSWGICCSASSTFGRVGQPPERTLYSLDAVAAPQLLASAPDKSCDLTTVGMVLIFPKSPSDGAYTFPSVVQPCWNLDGEFRKEQENSHRHARTPRLRNRYLPLSLQFILLFTSCPENRWLLLLLPAGC